jgi:thiamine phosphate synthase YjbQ (UPF0047 family)
MSSSPSEIRLTLEPARRFEAIDVTKRVEAEAGDILARHPKAFYTSLHTTAGYLHHSLSARLHHRSDRLDLFFNAFRALFPPDGAYRHDQLHLRTELSEKQREVEPKNGDSHLTFIGAGMRNAVTYRNRPDTPVYFIDLDGTNAGTRRQRTTSVLAYDDEEVVDQTVITVPVSRHPIDSINLADPRLGVVDTINERLARAGLEKGRVDIALDPAERGVGLTVNEYETMLMQHDLVEVLRNPLKFAALKSRHMLDDPLAIPSKTINYAKYDFVRVLNSLMEAFRVNESALERLVAKVMAVPASRLLRSRRVSFLASDHGGEGRARLVRGQYQSPILVQWQPAEKQVREVQVSLVRLR